MIFAEGTRESPGPRRLGVMWGGGKDSTLALLLSMAMCEETDSVVFAITMDNPGLSPGVRNNIQRVAGALGVEHQWWHFNQRAERFADAISDWQDLYRSLARTLGDDPRFMCIACNFASVIVESAALQANRADVLVTGNPGWETNVFALWMRELADEFPNEFALPASGAGTPLRYYQFWHQVNSALLKELFPADPAGAVERYLSGYPASDSGLARLQAINVLDDHQYACDSSFHRPLLESIGWRFPDDIPGGTESDCRFTAAIAHLNIRRKGLSGHLADIDAAHEHFKPYEQMRNRAIEWAKSGRSSEEGKSQLAEMGVSDADFGPRRPGIADALAKKLFRIR